MPTYAPDSNNLKLAVLIDAENVPRNCIKSVMEEVAIYGTPTIKRIYGDWTNPSIAGWKHSLLENAITPIQQYGYTTGKNSSDSAMIIDAMDILYSEKTDGFVIVSSDSDFTRLAIRLREAGQRVVGIGERKTPSAFIAACDKFTYIEVIRARSESVRRDNDEAQNEQKKKALPEPEEAPHEQDEARAEPEDPREDTKSRKGGRGDAKPREGARGGEGAKPRPSKVPNMIVQLIANSVADLSGDSGVVFMGELGNLILKKQPDFDHRNFGYMSLTSMIKSIDRFEIDFRQTTDPNIKHVFVRDKEAT